MEYKICENCSEKLHVRTQKCPFCNTILTEKSKIVKEVIEEVNKPEDISQNTSEINDSEAKNIVSIDENIDDNTLPNKEVKDYVYKAEVRHSLEYTHLMPNSLKVFLTAISMIPVIGQIIGTFFGVFFLTYDDNDRKSFGKSLIGLSIIMFFIYAYNVAMFYKLLETQGFSELMNGIQQ